MGAYPNNCCCEPGCTCPLLEGTTPRCIMLRVEGFSDLTEWTPVPDDGACQSCSCINGQEFILYCVKPSSEDECVWRWQGSTDGWYSFSCQQSGDNNIAVTIWEDESGKHVTVNFGDTGRGCAMIFETDLTTEPSLWVAFPVPFSAFGSARACCDVADGPVVYLSAIDRGDDNCDEDAPHPCMLCDCTRFGDSPELEVTLDGLTDETCECCADFDGTYILTQYGTGADCTWAYQWPSAPGGEGCAEDCAGNAPWLALKLTKIGDTVFRARLGIYQGAVFGEALVLGSPLVVWDHDVVHASHAPPACVDLLTWEVAGPTPGLMICSGGTASVSIAA